MGVSRSASTVIAYAMKEYGWNLDRAFDYVKERRTVTKPNPSFMKQLEEYQGILLARWAFIFHVQPIDKLYETHEYDKVCMICVWIKMQCGWPSAWHFLQVKGNILIM